MNDIYFLALATVACAFGAGLVVGRLTGVIRNG